MTKSVEPVAAMNDTAIRSKLTEWLAKEFSHDQTTVVYQEFAVPRPAARADVVVVNGRLSGFEIKSDLDNFSRLSQQMFSFSSVFERVTLVTTRRHIDKAIVYVPSWWGILMASPSVSLKPIRLARMNRGVDINKALYLLSCQELRNLLYENKLLPNRALSKGDLISMLCKSTSRQKLMADIRFSLKGRLNRANHQNHRSLADT